jgi:hypothetical protein
MNWNIYPGIGCLELSVSVEDRQYGQSIHHSVIRYSTLGLTFSGPRRDADNPSLRYLILQSSMFVPGCATVARPATLIATEVVAMNAKVMPFSAVSTVFHQCRLHLLEFSIRNLIAFPGACPLPLRFLPGPGALHHSTASTLTTWMGKSQWFVVSSHRRFSSLLKASWSGKSCLATSASDCPGGASSEARTMITR